MYKIQHKNNRPQYKALRNHYLTVHAEFVGFTDSCAELYCVRLNIYLLKIGLSSCLMFCF